MNKEYAEILEKLLVLEKLLITEVERNGERINKMRQICDHMRDIVYALYGSSITIDGVGDLGNL